MQAGSVVKRVCLRFCIGRGGKAIRGYKGYMENLCCKIKYFLLPLLKAVK